MSLLKYIEAERFEWQEHWFPSPEEHFRLVSLKIDVSKAIEKDNVVQYILTNQGVNAIENAKMKIEEEIGEEMIEEAIYKDIHG